MRTILIAEGDPVFAEQLATELRAGGYRVITCPGPWPPAERCIRCDTGWCPLTEGADLLLYNPELTALDASGRRYNLAIDSAQAHPELPMLLAWPAGGEPDPLTVHQVRAAVPNAQVAALQSAALLRQIGELLAPTTVAR